MYSRLTPRHGLQVLAALADIAILSALGAGYVKLRHDQSARKLMYSNLPFVLSAYYWTEDKISGGQLKGSRLRQADLNHWLLNIEESHVNGEGEATDEEEEDDEDEEEDDEEEL